MKYLNNFYTISTILILATTGFAYSISFSNSILLNLANLNIATIFFAMIFSMYFSKSKLFVLLFLPLFYNLYMYYPNLLYLQGGVNSFWYMYPLSISIGFLFISLLQERGLFSYYGLLKFLVVFIVLLGSYMYIQNFSIHTKEALDAKIFDFSLPSSIKLNDISFILILLTLSLSTLTTALLFKKDSDKALLGLYIALIIPALFFHANKYFILLSFIGAVLVIISILKDTYKMAYIDTLTSIPARRALEDEFLKLGSTYTIAMIDIDFFKKFNDTYGHDTGDEVLKLVATMISTVKGGGKAFRYGGEEFTILFANKKADDALIFLEEVREKIAKRGFIIRDKNRPDTKQKETPKAQNSKKVNLSVSIGVANSTKNSKLPQDVMKNADIALYKAKESGRNCSIIFK